MRCLFRRLKLESSHTIITRKCYLSVSWGLAWCSIRQFCRHRRPTFQHLLFVALHTCLECKALRKSCATNVPTTTIPHGRKINHVIARVRTNSCDSTLRLLTVLTTPEAQLVRLILSIWNFAPTSMILEALSFVISFVTVQCTTLFRPGFAVQIKSNWFMADIVLRTSGGPAVSLSQPHLVVR